MKHKMGIETKMSLIILLMILVSTTAVGVYGFLTVRNDSVEGNAKNAQNIAQIIASSIDAEAFTEIINSNTKNDYWHEIKNFLDETKKMTDVLHLYVLDNNPSAPTYFAEGSKPGDDLKIISDLGKRKSGTVTDEAYEAVSTGKQTATKIYYTESGDVLSAFAPVINISGKVVGLVGVDISADKVLANPHNMALRTIIAVICCTLLFVIFIDRYIKCTVSKPLDLISNAAELISKGNINIDLASINPKYMEISRLCTAVKDVSKTLNMLTDDMDNMSSLHASGDYQYKLDESKYNGVYANVVNAANSTTFIYVDMFNELLDVLKSFGKGNFQANVREYPGKLSIGNLIINELRSDLKKVNDEILVLVKAIKDGNISVRTNKEGFRGSWRKMLNNLNELVDVLTNPLEEIIKVLSEISVGNLSAKMSGDYKGYFAKVQNTINTTTTTLSGYVGSISAIVKQLASNDLDVNTKHNFQGDFVVIGDSLNALSANFNVIISEIAETAGIVLSGARQMSESSSVLMQGVIQQSSVMKNVLDDIDVCAEQTRQDGINAEKTRNISLQSKNDINTSSDEMKNLLNAIDGIREASRNIASIIRVIDDIAFQTNLLALNAAVEAARAGEYGSGFAVVAEEVRSLATRSQKAASETADLINDTVSRVSTGTDLANNTAAFLNKTVDGILNISELMAIIEASGEIQSKSFGNARQGLDSVSEILQGNSEISKENAAISEEMYSQAEALRNRIDVFKLKKSQR